MNETIYQTELDSNGRNLTELSKDLHVMTLNPSNITVTTITAHTKLFDWEINLFSIEHYFSVYGTTEFPEIGKITVNFGKQRNPLTDKRIFFTAIWFIIQCPIGPEPHNVCLKFWQNGSMHVTGLRDHPVEMKWLSKWIGTFLAHIQSRPVNCHIEKDKKNFDLLVCEHRVIWSSHTKRPIGWIPPSSSAISCHAPPPLKQKRTSKTISKAGLKAPQTVILHGKPVRYDEHSSSLYPFVTTKGKKERFTKDGEKIDQTFLAGESTDFSFATTNHPERDYCNYIPQHLTWKVVCLNAKCELARDFSTKQWLSRDHFAGYMREVYKNIMTSFDPNSYKAVQLTFYDENPVYLEHRNTSTNPMPASQGTKQIGTVSVTSTGLFWLYGFKDLEVAKEVASDVVGLLQLYKQHYPNILSSK